MLSAICFNLDQSKILSSGNGLSLLVTPSKKAFENMVGKGENGASHHFLIAQIKFQFLIQIYFDVIQCFQF